jgi:hypothetical protein
MNNNASEMDVARNSLDKLLLGLSVGKVVVVDDFFEKEFDHETIIGWLSIPDSEIPDALSAKLEEIDFSNPEVWKRQFSEFWDNLDGDGKRDLALLVSEKLGKSLEDDRKIDQNLVALFGNKVVCLSPSDWEAKKGEYFKATNATEKLLCIFDQDLSLSKGFTSEGSKSGVGLIQEVKGNIPETSLCCLLTHTIPSIEKEIEHWKKLSLSVGLDLREFIPLAKLRLANDNHPSIFVDGIKKAALNRYFEDLKEVTKNIIEKSNQDAIKNFEEIDPYDFDAIVLRAAMSDGSWEVDAILRVYQILHKDHVLSNFLKPEAQSKIKNDVVSARKISSIQLHGVVKNFPQVRPLRKQELYQGVELLTHSPLEVGDIFQLGDAQKFYILLSQPCDLMVRETGERKNTTASLIKISRRETKDLDKLKSEKPDIFFDLWKTRAELKYFFETTKFQAVVSFEDKLEVSLDVLDLSVLSDTGYCLVDINKIPEVPYYLTDGWQLRLNKLLQHYQSLHANLGKYEKSLDSVDADLKPILWKALMPKVTLTKSIFPETPYTTGKFDFQLKRIARYRQPWASRLLNLYSSYLSRDADDIDFVRFSE